MSDWIGFEEALAILIEDLPPERWADGRPPPRPGEPWPDDWPDDREFSRGAVEFFLKEQGIKGLCRIMARRETRAVHEEVSALEMRGLELLTTVGKPIPPGDLPEAMLMPPEHRMENPNIAWRNEIYHELRFFRDEIMKIRPRFLKWLGVEKPNTRSRAGDDAEAKKINKIVNFARENIGKRTVRAMAEHMVAQKRNEGLAPDTLRKILAGTYPPMKRLTITGLAK